MPSGRHSSRQMPEFLTYLLANGHTEDLALRYVKILGDMIASGVDTTNLDAIVHYRDKVAPKYHRQSLKHVLKLYAEQTGNSRIPAVPRRTAAMKSFDPKRVPEHDWRVAAFLFLIMKYHPGLTDEQILAFDRVKHCSDQTVARHLIYREISIPGANLLLEFRIDISSRAFLTLIWKDYWQRTILRNRSPGDTRLFVTGDGEGGSAPEVPFSVLSNWRSLVPHQQAAYDLAPDKDNGFSCTTVDKKAPTNLE